MISLLKSLSDRVFETISNYPRKILLSDEYTNYTGNDIQTFIAGIRQFIEIFSQKRGRIGILIPNSAVLAVAILAAIALGRVPVVLNSFARRDQIESLLPKLNLELLIISNAAYPELHSQCNMVSMDMSGGMSLVAVPGAERTHNLPREGTSIILYTSGSEGEPKGVQLSECGINYTVDHLIDCFGLDESTVSACIMPLCHTMGLNTQFLPTFFAGGKSVFFEITMSLGKIYRQIIQSECTFVGLVAEFLQLCYEEKDRRLLDPALNVRQIQIAGGPIREDHLRKAMHLFPHAVVHRGYGLTEAIRVSTIDSRDPNFLCDTEGYIWPGQDVEIRDEAGNTLPPDTVGYIYVRGPNVMVGYDNEDNDCRVMNGFLDTGDLGALTPDNRLFIHGRHDSIFKINGERVSGCEIENAARSLSPYFRELKCLALESNGRSRPVLFVELHPVQRENIFADLKSGFGGRLLKKLHNRRKMPGDIYLLSRFPRTYNGKIQYNDLKNIVANESAEYLGKGGGLRFFWLSPMSGSN